MTDMQSEAITFDTLVEDNAGVITGRALYRSQHGDEHMTQLLGDVNHAYAALANLVATEDGGE